MFILQFLHVLNLEQESALNKITKCVLNSYSVVCVGPSACTYFVFLNLVFQLGTADRDKRTGGDGSKVLCWLTAFKKNVLIFGIQSAF